MNTILPFMIDNALSRGAYISADTAISDMISCHDYPDTVNSVFAQSALLALALSNTIKYEGVFAFQIKGNGPIQSIYISVTHDKQMRGYCVFDESQLPENDLTNQALFGNANLLFSITQLGKDPYQGIVALSGNTLVDSVKEYFEVSEQIKTEIILRQQNGRYRCLFLQKMPKKSDMSLDEQNDIFVTSVILLHSVKDDELFDDTLAPEQLLYRLFHANELVVFNASCPVFSCACHQSQMKNFLDKLPDTERDDLFQDDEIKMQCQFCNKEYVFTKQDF